MSPAGSSKYGAVGMRSSADRLGGGKFGGGWLIGGGAVRLGMPGGGT